MALWYGCNEEKIFTLNVKEFLKLKWSSIVSLNCNMKTTVKMSRQIHHFCNSILMTKISVIRGVF